MPEPTASTEAPPRAAIKARTDVKPSARQVYAIAHMTVEALQLSWPGSRAEASELIGQLKALQAGAKTGGTDGIPF